MGSPMTECNLALMEINGLGIKPGVCFGPYILNKLLKKINDKLQT